MTEYTDLNHESVIIVARALWIATLSNTPMNQAMSKWMEDVRIGDLVLEVSSTLGQDDQVIGVLRDVGEEPVTDENGEVYTFSCYWILDTPSGEVRWTNAWFVRIPRNKHELKSMDMLAQRCPPSDHCSVCERAVKRIETGPDLREVRSH